MPAPATIEKRPSAPPPRARTKAHELDEKKPAWKAGLIGTVAAHVAIVLILLLMPEDLLETDQAASEPGANRPFEIELNPEWLRQAPPPLAPPRFVEVNPAAPENAPDKTPLVGAQNQQAAQPVPTPEGASDTPAVDGEDKANSTAIVSGLANEPDPPRPSEILEQAFQSPKPASTQPEPSKPDAPAEQEAARAVNALPGGEQILGEADGGIGSTVTKLPPVAGAESGAQPREGSASGKAKTGGYFSGTPKIDRSRPMDRPRLTSSTANARNTPTIKNDFGSKNIGAVAYNAKWSAYGEYLQRLIDAVQAQWERLILRSSFYPTSGALVKVEFRLDAKGDISEVVRVDGSGGELAQRLCVSAITERAPYGEWTEDMIAVLGKEQELTFTFHYQ